MLDERTPELIEFDNQHLETFRRIPGHPEIGALLAVDYCVEHQIPTPEWASAAVLELSLNLLSGNKSKRKGRHASYVAKLREGIYDIERWYAVQEVRRTRAEHKRDERRLRTRFPDGKVPDRFSNFQRRRGDWLKDGTYACAAKCLLGRNAYAGPSTMKASYRKIEKQLGDSSGHLIDAWLSDSLLKRLGLEGPMDQKPGHKILLFY